MTPQMVECDECGRSFELDNLVEISQAGGLTAVGFDCPHCYNLTISYWLDERLKIWRERLARFREKAGRSEKDWARYQRKKAEYQAAFDRLQAEAAPP